MEGKSAVLYKFLVVGVIVLFIGVGLQPGIAIDVSKSISDSEDDCNLCPRVSNQHNDSVEVIINILSGLLKQYPTAEDELQNLKEEITTPSEEDCFKLNILFVDFQVSSERFLDKGRLFLSGIYFLLYLITHFLWKTYCNPPLII
jgi:hypothetical protein